jgi:hypothetical protein
MHYYLMYVSYALEPFSDEMLESLLTVSRKNNDKYGITGMLLYIDGKFIQVLEGNKEDVNALFDNIRIDKRHKKVNVIIEGTSEKRNFPDWHMSFKSFTSKQFKKISGYHDLEQFFLDHPVTDESHVTYIFLRLFYNKYHKSTAIS